MKILVVDDERSVRDSLRRSLAFNGYGVVLASDGEEAISVIDREAPDLVILDILMPRIDGMEVCRILRSRGYEKPVLILTARGEVADRVAGLDAGADDYLPKPFALEELLARVRSLIRRRRIEARGEVPEDHELVFEDLSLNPQTREVRRGGRRINLTRTEFSLLQLLLQNPNRVLARSEILEEVWGYDFPTSGNALEVYIGYLRRKSEAAGEKRVIHTVRGVGYVLRSDTP
ncbi:MAG TPA: response regulator transcription factor [Corynebacterium sp.]|nr:response regulator transcription factor [Corynebacterium sp.]